MSESPLPQLNRAIAHIDTLWQQQQQINQGTINRFRLMSLYAQVWGLTLPARADWQCQIVEGSLSEVEKDE